MCLAPAAWRVEEPPHVHMHRGGGGIRVSGAEVSISGSGGGLGRSSASGGEISGTGKRRGVISSEALILRVRT